MSADSRSIDFHLPDAIKDFVFDMHDATRRSMRVSEVEPLYDTKFRDITEKYFASTAWPDTAAIASECSDDGVFLLFYRELTLRHAITKLKPQLIDHVEAWNNYCKLFHYLQHNLQTEMVISSQWACDIIGEFVYQFQAFCQYRTSLHNKSEADVTILQNNPDLWSVGLVMRILHDLIRVAKASSTTHAASIPTPTDEGNVHIHQLLGYFAVIEVARLECLLCDYSASLAWSAVIIPHLQQSTSSATSVVHANNAAGVETINGCPAQLFTNIPLCHINVYYHAGVSLLMLRRFSDALRTFNDIILHISQRLLKQGNVISNRPGTQQQLQRMLDRMLALAGLCLALYPVVYVSSSSSAATVTAPAAASTGRFGKDASAASAASTNAAATFTVSPICDQVRDLIEAQLGDKFRLLNAGEAAIFESVFEHNAPKFISAALPNYANAGRRGGRGNRQQQQDDDDDDDDTEEGNATKAAAAAAKEQASNTNYLCVDAIRTQQAVFSASVSQQLAVLKLRSYMRLYTSIGLEKLTRYDASSSSSSSSGGAHAAGASLSAAAANSATANNAAAAAATVVGSEEDMMAKLMSYKHKTLEVQGSTNCTAPNVSVLDVNYTVSDGTLYITNATNATAAKGVAGAAPTGGVAASTSAASRTAPNMAYFENIFTSQIGAHNALQTDIAKNFGKFGL